MPIDRYFVEHPFTQGERIQLTPEESRHLYKVMRARIGDTAESVNGRGQLGSGVVVELERDGASIRLEKVQEAKRKRPRLILAQGVPRTPRLDLIVEKGTELGVDAFWFFPGSRSDRQAPLTEHQMERLQRIAVASLKQSGRLFLPEIEWIPQISEWQQLPNLALFGDLRPSAPPLPTLLPSSDHIEEVAIIIGPESGLGEGEIQQLEALGGQGASLHTNVLRTDTAALAAISVITSCLGRRDLEGDQE